MNRCAICDITDEDNPKAGIRVVELWNHSEARCLTCHAEIEQCIEDMSIADEDFEFQDRSL